MSLQPLAAQPKLRQALGSAAARSARIQAPPSRLAVHRTRSMCGSSVPATASLQGVAVPEPHVLIRLGLVRKAAVAAWWGCRQAPPRCRRGWRGTKPLLPAPLHLHRSPCVISTVACGLGALWRKPGCGLRHWWAGCVCWSVASHPRSHPSAGWGRQSVMRSFTAAATVAGAECSAAAPIAIPQQPFRACSNHRSKRQSFSPHKPRPALVLSLLGSSAGVQPRPLDLQAAPIIIRRHTSAPPLPPPLAA